VTPTTLKEVLGQKAYMLFYVKRSLSYTQPLSKLLSSTQPASVPAPSEGRDKDEREVKPSMQHGGKMPPSHQLGGRGGHAITGMTL
jgi:ubiquitin carboxyl-terminal hydrolase 22/27/51